MDLNELNLSFLFNKVIINNTFFDMISRIRNACLVKSRRVYIVQSTTTLAIAKILKENNYIDSFLPNFVFNKVPYICLILNFTKDQRKCSSITSLSRISRPGLRIYTNATNLPKVLGGLGVSIFMFTNSF